MSHGSEAALQNTPVKVFAGRTGRPFAERICKYVGAELGDSETITFSEGSTFVRIGETVRDKDVYLVQSIGLQPNDEFVEILFWIDAFKRASANSVTLIMPYYGYAKGDKKDEPRVSIRARVCADAIETAGVDRVVMMDLHAPQIQGFFRKPVDHLHALPILCEYVKRLKIDNLVVVSPDAGFVKGARQFGGYLGVPVAVGDKTRMAHDEKAEVLDIIGDVEGKNALIVDDVVLSGGTLIELANELRNRGAKRILACVSHLLCHGEGLQRILASPIELLIGTDTVENPWATASERVEIVSVAPLFGEAIRRISTRQSVSELFDALPQHLIDTLAPA